MTRIAVVCLTPALGHLRPLLSIAAAARDSGMEPTVFVPDELDRFPRSEGLSTVKTGSFYGAEPAPDLAGFAARGILGQTWHGQIEWTREGRLTADTELLRRAPAIFEAVREVQPDLILADEHRLASVVRGFAGELRIPVVANVSTGTHRLCQPPAAVRHGPGIPRALELASNSLAKGRTRLFPLIQRVTRPDQSRRDRALSSDLAAAKEAFSKQYAQAPPAEVRITAGIGILETRHLAHLIRACPEVRDFGPTAPIDTGPIPEDLADWLSSTNDDPAVLVAFGSMVPLPDPAAKSLALALRANSFRAIWASPKPPPGIDPADRSGRIRWEPWVPQSALLGDDRVRAFVTHAGSGSTQEAIWFGKPMLCIPLAWDQYYNARVVELLGAGLRHTKSGRGQARLRRKLSTVVSDPKLAERSTQLGGELRQAEGTEPILALIRALVSDNP